MFNKVVLVGNLTRDIEMRYAQSGSAIGKTAIAVTRKFSTQQGDKKEETCFIDITFWGRTAEVANQYLNKGSKVLIEGRLMFDQWTDQNGQPRSKHSVSVENMEMLGSRADSGQGGNFGGGFSGQGGDPYGQSTPRQTRQNSYQQSQNHPQSPEKELPSIDIDDDDSELPF